MKVELQLKFLYSIVKYISLIICTQKHEFMQHKKSITQFFKHQNQS